MTASLRPLSRFDTSAVCDVFTETLALGQPLPFRLDGADWFSSLALGWYFEHGLDDSWWRSTTTPTSSGTGWCSLCRRRTGRGCAAARSPRQRGWPRWR